MGVVMCLFVWWEGHGDLDRLLGVLLLLLGHVSSSPPPFPTFATLGVLASPLSDMIHSRSINTVSQSLLAVECSFFSSSSFVLSQGPGSQGLFWDTGPWDPGTLVPSLRIVVRRVVRLVEEVENGVGGGGGDWCDGGYVAPVGRVEVVKMRPERELCCVRVVPFVFSLPMFYGRFFACSISMRSVACGALPCMCLKYKKSSPRCAITFRSGSRFRSWVNLSGTLG